MCTDRRTTRQTGPPGRDAPPSIKRTDGNHPNRTTRRKNGRDDRHEDDSEKRGSQHRTNVIEANPFSNLHPNPSGADSRLTLKEPTLPSVVRWTNPLHSKRNFHGHPQARRDSSYGDVSCKADGRFCGVNCSGPQHRVWKGVAAPGQSQPFACLPVRDLRSASSRSEVRSPHTLTQRKSSPTPAALTRAAPWHLWSNLLGRVASSTPPAHCVRREERPRIILSSDQRVTRHHADNSTSR